MESVWFDWTSTLWSLNWEKLWRSALTSGKSCIWRQNWWRRRLAWLLLESCNRSGRIWPSLGRFVWWPNRSISKIYQRKSWKIIPKLGKVLTLTQLPWDLWSRRCRISASWAWFSPTRPSFHLPPGSWLLHRILKKDHPMPAIAQSKYSILGWDFWCPSCDLVRVSCKTSLLPRHKTSWSLDELVILWNTNGLSWGPEEELVSQIALTHDLVSL